MENINRIFDKIYTTFLILFVLLFFCMGSYYFFNGIFAAKVTHILISFVFLLIMFTIIKKLLKTKENGKEDTLPI